MQFETDEIRLFGGSAGEATEVVLASGEENRGRANGGAVAERDDPAICFRSEGFDGEAAKNPGSQLVQRGPGGPHRERGARARAPEKEEIRYPPPAMAEAADCGSAKVQGHDSGLMEIGDS